MSKWPRKVRNIKQPTRYTRTNCEIREGKVWCSVIFCVADQQAVRRSVLVGVVFWGFRFQANAKPHECNQVVAECAKIKKIHVECK